MQEYFSLTIGILGMLWFSTALFQQNFSGFKNKQFSIFSVFVASALFINGFPHLFNSLSTASPTELFGFIGRTLGLIGSTIALHKPALKT